MEIKKKKNKDGCLKQNEIFVNFNYNIFSNYKV